MARPGVTHSPAGGGQASETPRQYVNFAFYKLDPDHPADRTRVVPGKSKYLFVYPFVKSRD